MTIPTTTDDLIADLNTVCDECLGSGREVHLECCGEQEEGCCRRPNQYKEICTHCDSKGRVR